jgi:hypothetical protein
MGYPIGLSLIVNEPYQRGIILAQQMLHITSCTQTLSRNRYVTRATTETTDSAERKKNGKHKTIS